MNNNTFAKKGTKLQLKHNHIGLFRSKSSMEVYGNNIAHAKRNTPFPNFSASATSSGVNFFNKTVSSTLAKNQFNKTMSHFITKNTSIENNREFIKDFSSYLQEKQKERDSYKRFKSPRQEVIKKLLNETKSESNIFNKTFSTNFMNTNEYNTLNDFYIVGHIYDKNLINDDDDTSEKEFLFRKYNLKQPLTSKERDKLQLHNNKVNNGVVEVNENQCFKNQYESYNLIKRNKNLHDHLMMHLNEEQIKSYLTKHFRIEEEKLKIDLMPKIKPIPIQHRKKPKKEEYTYQQNSNKLTVKTTINKLSDVQTLSRQMLFQEYHYIIVNQISNFIITPTTRSDSQMIQYLDEKSGEHKLLLYGGMNLVRLGGLWECFLSHNDKYGIQKYKWKRIVGITGDIPLPRAGHTVCLYRNDLVIYGGVIENETAYHYREDILIYNIPEKKFIADVCTNKGNVTWRKNHIAEIIGQFMLIYGGLDDNGKVLSEPWALDLYRMKWVQTKFTSGTYLPKLYYLSSQQVFPPQKKYHPKFSLFKVFKHIHTYSNLLYEGIYLFGGINDNGKCTNDLYIIQRGKPLSMIKPEIQGAPPMPRCQCSMNLFEKLNVLVIHGGRNEQIQAPFLNDFFFLDLERMLWIRIETNDIDIPHRAGHTAGLIENDLIIFGGYNDKHFVKSDLMVCNLDIIESGNVMKRNNKLKKEKKKYKETDKDINIESGLIGEGNENLTTNMQNTKSINLKESPYVLINSQIQSSKSFFEKFPLQKQILKQRFEEIEKINFLSNTNNGNNKHEKHKSMFQVYE